MTDPQASHGLVVTTAGAFGGIALILVYIASMAAKHKKGPATGAVIRLFLESWVAIGSVLLAAKIFSGAPIGQQAEDYFYLLTGLVAAIYVSGKHAAGMFRSLFKPKPVGWEPSTENADE